MKSPGVVLIESMEGSHKSKWTQNEPKQKYEKHISQKDIWKKAKVCEEDLSKGSDLWKKKYLWKKKFPAKGEILRWGAHRLKNNQNMNKIIN